MFCLTRIVLFTILLSECSSRIDVANLVDSVDYHKRTIMKEKNKRKNSYEKVFLKSFKDNSTLIDDEAPPFSQTMLENDYSSNYEREAKMKKLDNLSVAEASIKYGLPSVIDKCVKQGQIALTFDDGVSKITQDVLDILKLENVKATFFVLGNTLDSPILGEEYAKSILMQMLNDGHTIGSHSYSHPNFDEYWPEGIQHEMNKTRDLFQKQIGKAPRFMRPPFGNVTPRTIQTLHELGYFIIKWNVDTNDWMYTEAPEKSFREFSSKLPDEEKINNVRWQKNGLTELGVKTIINGILGSKIALMHDIHSGIVHFLPKLIHHARLLGYKLVSMDECLGRINPYFEDTD